MTHVHHRESNPHCGQQVGLSSAPLPGSWRVGRAGFPFPIFFFGSSPFSFLSSASLFEPRRRTRARTIFALDLAPLPLDPCAIQALIAWSAVLWLLEVDKNTCMHNAPIAITLRFAMPPFLLLVLCILPDRPLLLMAELQRAVRGV